MRAPAPSSLLVEHPALPRPFAVGDRPPTGDILDLGSVDRRAVAVQLLAATALLAEVELWPGRWALRRARVEMTDGGPQARLPTLPVPLSTIWSRLGGGEPAAAASRAAVLEAVAAATGLGLDPDDVGAVEPGFFLDGALSRLLDELPRPLDRATAGCLWLWRWSLPPLPDPGDTCLVDAPDPATARRIGAALWAAARRRGRDASFSVVTGGRPMTVAGGEAGGELAVVAGELDDDALASLIGRAADGRAASLAVGGLPPTWRTAALPVFDPKRLSAHLFITGVPPARRTAVVEGQAGRLDPFAAADRRRLDELAAGRFAETRPVRRGRHAGLVRVAGLAPEGLPIDRALALADADGAELEAAAAEGAVLIRDDRVLLPGPVALSADPRHAEVATIFDADDPRRLLHGALASGDTGEILRWARERLDDLDAVAVRRLLSGLAPGALGPGVQAALAEACLTLADIRGAERALEGLEPELARPWLAWLKLLDRTPEEEIVRPRPIDLESAPRACAEVGLVILRRAMEVDRNAVTEAIELLGAAIGRLRGARRRWVEIRMVARSDPGRLDDRAWRRAAVGGHPELAGLALFERSIQATLDGNPARARRLLRRVMNAERSPGRLALMQVNMGVLEGDLGRPRVAEALTLGAYLLFRAAGFRRREHDALHNLAVADIDELRAERASARLDELARGDDSLFVAVERARLALALGDLGGFRERLAALPGAMTAARPQVEQAVSFLRGAEALLGGSTGEAIGLLRAGGREGETWLALAAAVAGSEGGGEATPVDGWGVGRAAELVRALRSGDGPAIPETTLEIDRRTDHAMAVALCHTLAAHPGWPGPELRRRAARTLSRGGLDGWAARLRLAPDEVDALLRGMATLARRRAAGQPVGDEALADLSGPLGVDGLVLRSAGDGRELARSGAGEPAESVRRGDLELVALGTPFGRGRALDLLGELIELVPPTGVGADQPRVEHEVRIDGPSEAARRLRDEIWKAAPSALTVLIQGETGVGKEVVASEIHRLSGRSGKLVPVNVAAIPASLLDAELFGSLKGAFTGADRSRRGLAAAADGGTLFLDEVGDLDLALQVKLLRFLESGEIRAVGSDDTRRVDVRVICATHRNLERMVREGRFRQDLFFRIAVVRLRVPSLRERLADIPALRSIFEREAATRHGLRVGPWSAAAERRLLDHRWPGNVRELKHTVEVAMARAAGATIRPDHLPLGESEGEPRGTWEGALTEFKRRLLVEVLGRHDGNRSAAARELGISRQALLYQITKLGLTGT
ncbi:MAG: sigma 54-interacting transcriptional regulator [Thermoanaerobaculales bacterium]|jgi:DNA-binding NtrC family response regulator|nr:sigma 54-interacting transcriptional regulator [Thermoanaerobaculales bacterium]